MSKVIQKFTKELKYSGTDEECNSFFSKIVPAFQENFSVISDEDYEKIIKVVEPKPEGRPSYGTPEAIEAAKQKRKNELKSFVENLPQNEKQYLKNLLNKKGEE